MKFTKMHGAGNDFILVNNFEEKIPEEKMGAIAARLCTRRLSIGADGMMFVCPPEEGTDFKMMFFNSDGTMGEMCGNGARCIARYGHDKGFSGDVQRFETTAGIVSGERIDDRYYRVRLNDITKTAPAVPVAYEGKDYLCDYVELGDPGLPHIAVEMPGLSGLTKEDLRGLGEALRHAAVFPKGANVNFYEVTGEDRVLELTYERGVEDFTLACGTGTGAVVSVLTMKGKVSGKGTRVTVPGGELRIDAEKGEDGRIKAIYLTGPTNVVSEGEVRDEDLQI